MTMESSPSTADIAFDAGKLTKGQRRIALTAVGGYFVDGYDLLILGGALLAIRPELGLSSGMAGLVTAAAFIGMAVGSPLSGPLTDRFGRKPIFFTAMALFVLGSVLTLTVSAVWALVALRFVVGLAIGADMPPSAALITEFIPSRRRGTFTALGGVAWMLGGLVAIAVTLLIFVATGGPDHWRWVLATGAIPAFALMLLRHRTPESPYWLRARGRNAEALDAWRYARGEQGEPAAEPEPAGHEAAKASTQFRRLLRAPFALLLLCVCVYWGFNNLYGSALLLYQPTLISRIVTPSTYTTLLFTAATTLAATVVGLIVCLWVVESVGRRFIALAGTALFVLASVVIYVGIDSAAVVLLAFGVAISVINGGTSLAFYSWSPELFPTSVRGTAVGIANMIGKAGSVVGTLLLPSLYDTVGNGIFPLLAAAGVLNLIVVFVLAPETKGRSLAELERGISRVRPKR